MRYKLKSGHFQWHHEHSYTKHKATTKQSNNITIIIVTLIAFVLLLINTLTNTSDVGNSDNKELPSQATTAKDNIKFVISNATPTNKPLLSNENTEPLQQSAARGHGYNQQRHQSVNVDIVDVDVVDGHNGFYDKINTTNQRNKFKRLSKTATTTTKSSSEQFFEEIELRESLSSPSSSSSSSSSTSSSSSSSSSSSLPTSSYHRQLLPHRNKRYLVFPKGSSFQMIFDLIIGIVDYSSYAILGITCAVAWELPDKPPSELIEDVQLRLNEGTLGLRRNDSTQTQLKYVDKVVGVSGAVSEPATIATAEQQQEHLTATTAYYNNYNPWWMVKEPPSVPVNGPLAGYNAYHPYNNNNNNNNNYYAGNYNDISNNNDKIDERKSLQQQSGGGGTNANSYAATHLNTHTVDYYGKNNMGAYNGVKSTSGYMNNNAWNREKSVAWNRNRQESLYDGTYNNKYATNGGRKHWWAQNGERKQQAWQQRQQEWTKKYEQSTPQLQNPPMQPHPSPVFPTFGAGASRNGRVRQILQKSPKHHIYPVFGKKRKRRRATSDMTDFERKMDSVHLRAHLQSRQLLYGKIEKLYRVHSDGRHNGTECVMRAICETAERQNQRSKPQSFISELLRVIFSMPHHQHMEEEEHHRIAAHELAGHFRDANAAATDCESRYPLCGHSFWSDLEFGMKM